MNPGILIFYFFAAVAVVGAVMMITRKNAVHAAVYLVLTFVSISAIYILLGAEFLFAVQVLVYAGGIMVLFLFVIMLVNLDEPRRFSGGRLQIGLSTALALVLFVMLVRVFARGGPPGPASAGDLGGSETSSWSERASTGITCFPSKPSPCFFWSP